MKVIVSLDPESGDFFNREFDLPISSPVFTHLHVKIGKKEEILAVNSVRWFEKGGKIVLGCVFDEESMFNPGPHEAILKTLEKDKKWKKVENYLD